jgi:hypothetical protein
LSPVPLAHPDQPGDRSDQDKLSTATTTTSRCAPSGRSRRPRRSRPRRARPLGVIKLAVAHLAQVQLGQDEIAVDRRCRRGPRVPVAHGNARGTRLREGADPDRGGKWGRSRGGVPIWPGCPAGWPVERSAVCPDSGRMTTRAEIETHYFECHDEAACLPPVPTPAGTAGTASGRGPGSHLEGSTLNSRLERARMQEFLLGICPNHLPRLPISATY